MRTLTSQSFVWWPFVLLLVAVAGLYGQSLGFGYVWDDGALFLDNTLLREGDWSWAAVARPILPDTAYFRPMVLTTWMAEMQLFKLTPLYSHAVNTVLHGINTCLVYVIARRILGRCEETRNVALISAMLFTSHPCLVEGVAWISGRFDLLATTFLLAGFYTSMAPPTVQRSILVGLLVLGAMLSKETGVLFAPLLVLIVVARNPVQSVRSIVAGIWPYLVAFTVAAVIYFALRSKGLGFASYSNFGFLQLMGALLDYEVWMRTLSFYTFMSFMPFSSISPQHDVLLELASARQHAAALVAALAILLAVIWFSLKRNAWAIIWLGFYVGIFPVLGIFSIRLGDAIGAERFLYLPLAMLSIALGALFLKIQDSFPGKLVIKRGSLILVCGWLSLSFLVTYTVTSMWESGVKLWSWQYQSRPQNRMVLNNYLMQLSNSRQPELEDEFEREIKKIQSRHGGSLPGEVQLLYAAYLLVKNDSESLSYLEGLVRSSKGIWDLNPEELGARNSTMYAGILVNYAQALMIFTGDLKIARASLDRAQVITTRGSEFQIIHPMIAIEFLEGNPAIALDLYRKNLDILHAYNIHKMHASIRTLIEFTCIRRSDENCKQKALNFVEYLKKESSSLSN